MSFWPTLDHWSVAIPLDTPHRRLDALADTGFVALRDLPYDIPESEFVNLEYMDWKSGGDTNFAPLASADGELGAHCARCRAVLSPAAADRWPRSADESSMT